MGLSVWAGCMNKCAPLPLKNINGCTLLGHFSCLHVGTLSCGFHGLSEWWEWGRYWRRLCWLTYTCLSYCMSSCDFFKFVLTWQGTKYPPNTQIELHAVAHLLHTAWEFQFQWCHWVHIWWSSTFFSFLFAVVEIPCLVMFFPPYSWLLVSGVNAPLPNLIHPFLLPHSLTNTIPIWIK